MQKFYLHNGGFIFWFQDEFVYLLMQCLNRRFFGRWLLSRFVCACVCVFGFERGCISGFHCYTNPGSKSQICLCAKRAENLLTTVGQWSNFWVWAFFACSYSSQQFIFFLVFTPNYQLGLVYLFELLKIQL